jgi:uncharacterized membrane protein
MKDVGKDGPTLLTAVNVRETDWRLIERNIEMTDANFVKPALQGDSEFFVSSCFSRLDAFPAIDSCF